MKARIHEALHHRHDTEDKGFTLIELLVVILIIAILAAVGIVALLSALDSGKKSAAKTTLRTAMSAVRSMQVGSGAEDFSGLTLLAMQTVEPDITWVLNPLAATAPTNSVGIGGNGTNIAVLNTRDSSGHCFYVLLNVSGPTGYASATVASDAACPAFPTITPPVVSTSDTFAASTWFNRQDVGWRAS